MGEFKKLSTVARELNIPSFELVKMDIEHAEYDLLPGVLSDFRPKQVLVEIHVDPLVSKNWAKALLSLATSIYENGYEVALRERNVTRMEFVLVRSDVETIHRQV